MKRRLSKIKRDVKLLTLQPTKVWEFLPDILALLHGLAGPPSSDGVVCLCEIGWCWQSSFHTNFFHLQYCALYIFCMPGKERWEHSHELPETDSRDERIGGDYQFTRRSFFPLVREARTAFTCLASRIPSASCCHARSLCTYLKKNQKTSLQFVFD